MESPGLTLISTVVAVDGALLEFGLLAWAAARYARTRRLEKQFGPEYHHALHESGNRAEAEKELAARVSHVKSLQIRSLSEGERDRFAHAWRSGQARFIDEPAAALREADKLIKEVMAAKGYPVESFDERAADISVDYPDLVRHYRTLRHVAERDGGKDLDTEEMRQAMLDSRLLFEQLLATKVDEHPYEAEREKTL
jgi:hypothetical protein